MKYQTTISVMKTVDDWDNEQGASGNVRGIDNWRETIVTSGKPTRRDLNNILYDGRYTLKINQFRHWPDEPGRFTTNRIEDGDGNEDPRGHYLADYDMRLECTPLQNPVNIGTFGLKSVDQ
jgi:hypothetical protein